MIFSTSTLRIDIAEFNAPSLRIRVSTLRTSLSWKWKPPTWRGAPSSASCRRPKVTKKSSMGRLTRAHVSSIQKLVLSAIAPGCTMSPAVVGNPCEQNVVMAALDDVNRIDLHVPHVPDCRGVAAGPGQKELGCSALCVQPIRLAWDWVIGD